MERTPLLRRTEPSGPKPEGVPLLTLAFWTCCLAGAAAAAGLVGLCHVILFGGFGLPTARLPLLWQAHERVFGWVVIAIMVVFLFTTAKTRTARGLTGCALNTSRTAALMFTLLPASALTCMGRMTCWTDAFSKWAWYSQGCSGSASFDSMYSAVPLADAPSGRRKGGLNSPVYSQVSTPSRRLARISR